MSEQNNENARLAIEEEIIASQMDDMLKKNALNFVAYLKASGMTPHANHSNAFTYLDKWVCILCMYPADDVLGWTVFDSPICGSEYNGYPLAEELKEFAWAHVNKCGNCGCGNQPGAHETILGKQFDNVCTSFVAFRNPEGETLEKVKKLIETWKCTIDGAA